MTFNAAWLKGRFGEADPACPRRTGIPDDETALIAEFREAQIQAVGQGIARVGPVIMVIALVTAFVMREAPYALAILFFAGWQIVVSLVAQRVVRSARWSSRNMRNASAIRIIVGYTALISIGWSGLLILSGLGAPPPYQTTLLCLHIGIISVGGLTYAMVPAASLTYVGIMSASALLHTRMMTQDLPLLLYAAILLFGILLARAYMQTGQQFMGQMRRDARLRAMERDRLDQERELLQRRTAAEREQQMHRETAQAAAQSERRAAMLTIARQYEDSVTSLRRELEEAVARLAGTAEEMESINASTLNGTRQVLDLAHGSAQAISSVARSTEQLKQSAAEISAQTDEQVEMGKAAHVASDAGRTSLSSLLDQANSIGEITGLIQQLATRTTLLSLNATIEAARAGDAGRGFAVVAQEVKQLANQTQGAVARISDILSGTRTRMVGTNEAMDGIAANIDAMSLRAAGIAKAAQSQREATVNISAAAAQTAAASHAVEHTIEKLSDDAHKADTLAADLRRTVTSLRERAEALKAGSNAFLASLRDERSA